MTAPIDTMAQAVGNVDWVVTIADTAVGSPPKNYDPTSAGSTIQYAVTVANSGYSAAQPTTITFDIPATTTFTGVTGSLTNCQPSPATGQTLVTCDVPGLASGGQEAAIISVLTTVSGTVEVTATVPATGDVDPNNNSGSEVTTVRSAADMSLTLNAPARAVSGGLITYDFTATNSGPDPVSNLNLTFPVPTGITSVAAPAGCTLSGSSYACTIAGPVTVGASVTRNFTGRVFAVSGSDITAAGSISGGSEFDPFLANNTATATTRVDPGTTLDIEKTRSPAQVFVNDIVTFTLTNRYTGESPTGISVVDTLPPNYGNIGVNAPGWNVVVSGQTVTATLVSGSGAGANKDLGNIVITATALTSGTAPNTATITATGPGTVTPDTDTDGTGTILDAIVDLKANKSGPSPALAVVGNSYNFPISASNIGNKAFAGTLQMTDTIPPNLTVTSLTLNGWTCTPSSPLPLAGPGTISCERIYTAGSPLAPNATSPAVVVGATVTGTGSIVNSLNVGSPTEPETGLLANNTISYGITATTGPNSADIAVLKTAAISPVAAGDIETFRIEITNAGPRPSTNITLTDELTQLINNSNSGANPGLVSVTPQANSASGLSCTSATLGGTGRKLTCTIPSLPVCSAGVNCPVIEVKVRPGGNGGSRTNTAEAYSADVPDSAVANNTASASYTVDARADVTVTKTSSPNPVRAGQDLTYVIAARNISNGLSSAGAVTITDTLPPNLTFVSATSVQGTCGTKPAANSLTGASSNNLVICNLGNIANGAQRTVTVIVRPTLTLVDQALANNVNVTTTTTETNASNNSALNETPVLPPQLDLLVNKTDSADPVTLGEDTVYTITVTNNGPSAAENVAVTDTMPGSILSYQSYSSPADGGCGTIPGTGTFGGTLACNFPLLLAGQSRVINVTMRGEARGIATNTVTVESDETRKGYESIRNNNTAIQKTTVRARVDMEVASKTVNPTVVAPNQNFDFDIVVRNRSNAAGTDADNVLVSDTLPAGMELTGTPTVTVQAGTVTSTACTGAAGGTSVICNLGTVSPGGQVSIRVPVRVTVTTSNPQVFTNSASVSTSSLDEVAANNSNSGTVTVSIPGIELTKTASLASYVLGDTITYTFSARNSGAITLSDVSVSDPLPGLSAVSWQSNSNGSVQGTLLPGETATFTATLTVTQERVDAGSIQNTASVTGSPPSGPAVVDDDSLTITGPTPAPALTLTKTADKASYAPGDTVTYTFEARNTGNVTLTAVSVSDPLPGLSAVSWQSNSNGSAQGTLLPGETATFTATLAVTQEQVDAGVTQNVATAIGKPPSGPAVTDDATKTITGPASAPALMMTKTADKAAYSTLDEVVIYSFAVTNTGNVTLSDVWVSDPLQGVSSMTPESVATLAPGETTTFTAELRINQENLDAGEIVNTATAGAKDPAGTPVPPVEDEVTITATQNSALTLTKTADKASYAPGDTVTYTFEAKNTGNVTLTAVSVSDPFPDLSAVSWQSNSNGSAQGTLLPGETATFTATLTVTQEQVDAGSIQNTASVTGTPPSGPAVVDDDTLTITGPTPAPALTLTKTADKASYAPGDMVTYTFEAKNTGNVTLTAVSVSDPLPGLSAVSWQSNSNGSAQGTLLPGETATFTATLAVTQEQVDAGSIQNTASVTGSPPSGPAVVDDASVTVAVDQKREIALVKKGSVQGDQVTFTYVATNTGNITLFNVSVIEERSNFSGTGALPAPAYKSGGANLDEDPADARNDLVPGESVTWTASYTMTKADIAAGVLINQAEARSKSPDGRDVADPSGTTGENDDPTRVEVKLIDIVKNELKDALSDHLQGLITVESGLFSSLAGKGAERLRSPEDCIDSDPNAVNGNFLAEYNPDGFVLNADAAVHKLLSSCAERTRYILDSQIDVRHMDEVTAATVSGTLIRETLVDEGTLFGQFAGGYFDLPAGGDDYDGTITGIGLHAGVYGARRVGDDLIADGYLAVSAGRQTFDLKLGEGLSIVTEGESRYAAGYAGAALSGEMEVRDFVVEPRVSFDTAYAMPWMESLELSLGDLQQRASLDLPELGLVRITNQFRFTPVGMTSADAGGFTWAATPLAFCQYNFGNESDLKCGGGLGLDLGYMNESRDKEFRISLSAEAAPDHYLGSGMMRYIWYIEEGRGSSEFSLGLTGQGAAQVGYSFDWKW